MIGTLSEDAGQHQVVPSSSDGYLGRIMRGHARTSGLLPRRVHLPVQPAPLAQLRHAVLPPRAASRRPRPGAARVVGHVRPIALKCVVPYVPSDVRVQ